MRALFRRAILVAALGLAGASTAVAVDLQRVLADYTITTWSQKDGLPSNAVLALAQDLEGYLWIGTARGLLRFDGVRFTPWPAPGAEDGRQPAVTALCVAQDGSLFVGLGGRGGLVRIRGVQARSYHDTDGLPQAEVFAIVEDRDRTIWAGTSSGLFQLAGDRWQRVATTAGVSSGSVYAAIIDHSGGLIVGGDAGVFRRDVGQQTFTLIEAAPHIERRVSGPPIDRRDIVEDASGAFWISDQLSGFRPLGHPLPASRIVEWGRGVSLLFDHIENLWVGTLGQGLWRVQRDSERFLVERATALTGLMGDGIYALLQDKEGNIWAGTDEGLSRLTQRRFTQYTNFGLVVGLGVTSRGDIWVGAVDELVLWSSRSGSELARIPLGSARLHALYVDSADTLWSATDRAVFRMPRGTTTPEPLAGAEGLGAIDSITGDGAGGILLTASSGEVFDWNRGRPVSMRLPGDVAASRVMATLSDTARTVWLGLADGRVIAVGQDGSHRVFTTQDGLHAGEISEIYQDDGRNLWVAGLGVLRDLWAADS